MRYPMTLFMFMAISGLCATGPGSLKSQVSHDEWERIKTCVMASEVDSRANILRKRNIKPSSIGALYAMRSQVTPGGFLENTGDLEVDAQYNQLGCDDVLSRYTFRSLQEHPDVQHLRYNVGGRFFLYEDIFMQFNLLQNRYTYHDNPTRYAKHRRYLQNRALQEVSKLTSKPIDDDSVNFQEYSFI